VSVEVTIHTRLERCTGPLTLGDLVYSNTLFPGEKVRLFTTDRRSRFTFDSSTKLSYRTEQTHEEQFYMSSMHDFMSDLESSDRRSSTSSSQSHSDGHAGTGNFLENLFNGPSVNMSGNHNASSTSEFLRELNQHAQASDHRSQEGTRTARSDSIGELET